MAIQRTERTRAAGTMTEAAFWGFIREGIRSKHMRWRPRAVAMQLATRPIPPERRVGAQRVEVQCSICLEYYGRKEVEADHILPAGTLRTYEDLPGFVERLFCEAEGYRVLCKACHLTITRGNR